MTAAESNQDRAGEAAPHGTAVIIGASGGIGNALVRALSLTARYEAVIGLSRSSSPSLDVGVEASIEAAARHVEATGNALRLLVIATGFLHDEVNRPERSLRDLSASHFAKAFAINAIGPALVLKHFTPLLPRDGHAAVAVLSARVGSIGDNQLGGWHAYRASKAALNQIVRTASVELKRTRPGAICVALHPGTVDTKLSAPFSKSGLNVRPPEEAAADLLRVIDGLTPAQTGCFFDYSGKPLPW